MKTAMGAGDTIPARQRARSDGRRPHARFSVDEFHRLCEQLPERRLELIYGEVLEVIAKGSRHTAVVHRLARPDAWLDAHPTAADTLLVIEVADASLGYDLDTRLRLVQQAGITNYWVVDVREPMAFFLLQGNSEQPLLTAMREQVEALVAELRALK